jgi:hypothetical protein
VRARQERGEAAQSFGQVIDQVYLSRYWGHFKAARADREASPLCYFALQNWLNPAASPAVGVARRAKARKRAHRSCCSRGKMVGTAQVRLCHPTAPQSTMNSVALSAAPERWTIQLLLQMVRRSLDDAQLRIHPQILANPLPPLVRVEHHDAIRTDKHVDQREMQVRQECQSLAPIGTQGILARARAPECGPRSSRPRHRRARARAPGHANSRCRSTAAPRRRAPMADGDLALASSDICPRFQVEAN